MFSTNNNHQNDDDDTLDDDQNIVNKPTITAPYTGKDLTQCEITAIEKLAKDGLLYVAKEEQCPLPKVRKQLITEKSDFYINACPFNRRNRPALEDKMKPVETQLSALHRHLLVDVGDDVIAGTIFAVSNETKEDLDQAAAKRQVRNTDNGNKKSPLNPGCLRNPERATNSFPVTILGCEYTFPISEEDGYVLHSMASECRFGQEGVGDVLDHNIRKSREFAADTLQLPDFLHHPRSIYPELEEQIRLRLCPTAEQIAIKPYKLVVYGPGDFFASHLDSSDDPRHFGTLAIHLPSIGDYEDPRKLIDPDSFTWGDSKGEDDDNSNEDEYQDEVEEEEEDEEEEEEEEKKRKSAPAKTTKAEEAAFRRTIYKNGEDNDDGDDESKQKYRANTQERRTRGGALRFYLGRAIDAPRPGKAVFQNEFLGNRLWSTYGRPHHGEDQLVAAVVFQNYSNEEVYLGALPDWSVSANNLADVACSTHVASESKNHGGRRNGRDKVPVQTISRTASTSTDAKKDFSCAERRFTPCHFAAWNINTLHSVRPLKKGYRVVLTYKMYKVGELSIYHRAIPRADLLTSEFDKLVVAMKTYINAVKSEIKTKPEKAAVAGSFRTYPLTFGFLCRHIYSPAAVSSLGAYALKGIDLAVYRLIAEQFAPVIAPVLLCKDLDTGVCFNVDPTSRYKVMLTSEFPATNGATTVDLDREHAYEDVVSAGTPAIVRVLWKELGFGAVTGGGHSFGNCDCGADFYYRNFCIVASLTPGNWARRRWCFVAQYKSKDENGLFKRIGEYYPIFRRVCYFL